jgi:hypothetical protein
MTANTITRISTALAGFVLAAYALAFLVNAATWA